MKIMSNIILKYVKAHPNHKVTWYVGESNCHEGEKFVQITIHDLEEKDRLIRHRGYYDCELKTHTITLWLNHCDLRSYITEL